MSRTPHLPHASTEPRLWRHWCPLERLPLLVGCGEACSWCGDTERSPNLRLVGQADSPPATRPGVEG